MLHRDQDSWPASHGDHGLSGGPLTELAREIEETQRRQSDTLSHIVERLRALDLGRSDERPAASSYTSPSASPAHDGPREAGVRAGDEPWDKASAEALMLTCEAAEAVQQTRVPEPASMAGAHQDWLGFRFNDVTQRLKRTLKDLKPGSTMALLAERLDQFQKHIGLVLEDVVRRSDLDGLRLIEAHVNDLDDKLRQIERHVTRLDGIEADVRAVMDQVSEDRLARLFDYDARFAADLEAVAVRAAEQVHARLGQDGERAQADARRHQELRELIEASIHERRKAEAEAASVVAGLSGHVTAQADRYDELKALLEQAIQEQRQSEQTAVGMLDTLQQALVTVLDRIDALEQQQYAATAAPMPAEAYAEPQPYAEPQAFASFGDAAASRFGAPTFHTHEAHNAPPAGGFNDFAPAGGMEHHPHVEVPASFATPGIGDEPPAEDESGSTIDRIRRDFIADARRAKLKAAANRAEAIAEQAESPRRGAEPAPSVLGRARLPLPAGGGRLFGASPKLLAGALALVVAINGGLLLLNRKASTPPAVPEITLPEPAGAESGAGSGEAGKRQEPVPGPRSDLDGDDSNFAGLDDADGADPIVTPYGVRDDVLNPPAVESIDGAAPSAPTGTTLARPMGSLPEELVADVYQQQVLAGLSDQLGMIAAGKSADALLPDENGRIDTSYTDETPKPAGGAEKLQASALDLPPATVGPLSLRLAAANGDASAEFEVAARLAEGKGTEQSYAEALRWYQRSAAKGFAQSQYRLGTLYERGLGVAKDVGRARIWYGRAAEQGNVKSMHNLAVLAASGEHGEPDYAAASKWFAKAAAFGLADSQFNLGVLFENGLGVKADRVAAYKWYALAARGGDKDALAQRDALKPALNADELVRAERLVAEFKARAPHRLANDARAAGEDWKSRAGSDTNG